MVIHMQKLNIGSFAIGQWWFAWLAQTIIILGCVYGICTTSTKDCVPQFERLRSVRNLHHSLIHRASSTDNISPCYFDKQYRTMLLRPMWLPDTTNGNSERAKAVHCDAEFSIESTIISVFHLFQWISFFMWNELSHILELFLIVNQSQMQLSLWHEFHNNTVLP